MRGRAAGPGSDVPRARHGRRPRGGGHRPRGRWPARPDLPGRPVGAAARDRRPHDRGGHLRRAHRPAAGLPPAPRPLRGHRRRGGPDRHPALAGAAGVGPRPPLVGPRGPALQRAVEGVLGGRRPRRPDRPGGLVGGRAGRGLPAGQPAARRRAGRAAGAVALPAHLAPVLQPALRPGRARRGVRRAAGRLARTVEALSADVHAGSTPPTSSTATRPGPPSAPRSRSCTPLLAAPAGRRTWPRSGRGTVRPARLRDLERDRRRARRRLPHLARGPARRGLPRGRGVRGAAPPRDRLRDLAPVGRRRAARGGAGQGGRRRHGAGHDARPRRRRAPRRRGRVAVADDVRLPHPGRRPARPVQPDRPELEPAPVASGPAGGARLRAAARHGRARCSGTPAGSGSTTSSGCSGSGGSRRAGRRPRAPTCATTTRR